MQKKLIVAAALAGCAAMVAADWPTPSGSPERDGWARAEKTFTRENAGGLQLLYKYKSDNTSIGPNSLTSPIIDGFLITYRGFKEMLVFSGSGDNVYSVDADLNRLIWKRHFDSQAAAKPRKGCPAGLTAPVVMEGSSSAAVSFGRHPKRTSKKSLVGGFGFGRLGTFYAVSSDGYLHALNTSTGGDLVPPLSFLPAGANVTSLNVKENVVFAATRDDCGGPNGIYATDFDSGDKKIVSFLTQGSGISGLGPTVDMNGNVLAQVAGGHGKEAGDYRNTVLLLDGSSLQVKDYFTPKGPAPAKAQEGVTPLVFSWNEKELVVAAAGGRLYLLHAASLGGADHLTPLFRTGPIAAKGGDFTGAKQRGEVVGSAERSRIEGPNRPPAAATTSSFSFQEKTSGVTPSCVFAGGRLYLLDAASLGGADHLTPLFRTGPIAAKGGDFTGAFSSWIDLNTGTRWVYASLSGPLAKGAKFPLQNGAARHGSIVAFKLEDQGGHPILTPAWVSGDVPAPAPAVTTNGLVFALSRGASASSNATLFILDGASGKRLYSSARLVSGNARGSGLAVANRRVYFTTSDNTVYCFGFFKLEPQLTEK